MTDTITAQDLAAVQSALAQTKAPTAEQQGAQKQIAIQLAAQQSSLAIFNACTKTPGINSVWGTIKTEDFMNLRPFPYNRDVATRVKAKRNTHLKKLDSAQQLNVSVVITAENINKLFWNADKPVMIIDGHSRCEAWRQGKMPMPEYLNIQFFFDCPDLQVAKEYSVFNDSLAQATSGEHTKMLNQLNEYKPQSKFCQQSWKDAFKKLECTDYKEGLECYAPILIDHVDKWAITPDVGVNSTRRHSTGVKMAILKTYKDSHLSAWTKFWKDFFSVDSQIIESLFLREQLADIPTNKPNTIKDACMEKFNEYLQAGK